MIDPRRILSDGHGYAFQAQITPAPSGHIKANHMLGMQQ